MRKFLLALLAVAASLVVAAPSPAAAGGWALVSYDALPRLVAGEQATVTFRILQHGVHPIDLEQWGGGIMGLRVTGTDGATEVPAVATGAPGQFSASFAVPSGASVGLQVLWDDGLILQEDAIDVATVDSAEAGWSRWGPIAFAGATFGGLALVASELASRRRARTTPDHAATELVAT